MLIRFNILKNMLVPDVPLGKLMQQIIIKTRSGVLKLGKKDIANLKDA